MSIEIVHGDITEMDTDCIVNAANNELRSGGGVCGAIFWKAGFEELTKACSAIGGCPTGSAVITPGFALKAKYIIHTVGPVWSGGGYGEAEKLYGCYQSSLKLAVENGCRSIAFPLISAGIYGYPMEDAWKQAIRSCMDFENENPQAEIAIKFAVLSDWIEKTGRQVLEEIV